MITEQEVLKAQQLWGEGIVKIGRAFLEKGDFINAAINHINQLYGYNLGVVLFKPTMASEKPFRIDKEGALSYFIGGNHDYPEDHGFAIKSWLLVNWENVAIKIIGNVALAMGHYHFSPADGGEKVKVEFSFAYTKDDEGKLRIILHDSHLPFSPMH